MRKKDDTLQGKILDLAMDMVNTSGPNSVNIRSIAEKAEIATGTIYTYFSSKDDMLIALTERYWHKALLDMQSAIKPNIFYMQVEEIYNFLNHQINQSAGMLMGSLRNVETTGRDRMRSMQQSLSLVLIHYIEQDITIRKDVWSETFTKESYASFITMNLILLLQTKALDISFFTEIIKRTLY